MARHLCLSLFSLLPAPRSLPLLLWLASLLPISYFLSPIPISAQILPDGTVGTLVTGGPNFSINGGTRPSNGPNLFHSFSQFSVPTGGSDWPTDGSDRGLHPSSGRSPGSSGENIWGMRAI
jgi:hypothetical protein